MTENDRVRVIRDLTREYFYPFNTGKKPDQIVIPLGEVGLVKEINIKDGVMYDEVCVSFTSRDGRLGSWYIHKGDLEIVI